MQFDEWLSNLLEKDSYHIIDPSKINKKDLQGNNLFIDAKVNSQDVKTIIKLQELGFQCIDINIQFYKKLSISSLKKERTSLTYADKKDALSVKELSSIADALLWLKSIETNFSFVTFKMFFRYAFDAFENELFSFSIEIFFFTLIQIQSMIR